MLELLRRIAREERLPLAVAIAILLALIARHL